MCRLDQLSSPSERQIRVSRLGSMASGVRPPRSVMAWGSGCLGGEQLGEGSPACGCWLSGPAPQRGRGRGYRREGHDRRDDQHGAQHQLEVQRATDQCHGVQHGKGHQLRERLKDVTLAPDGGNGLDEPLRIQFLAQSAHHHLYGVGIPFAIP